MSSQFESRLERLKARLKELPERPGVYLHKNAEGEVIYVGKARNLRNRVGTYVVGRGARDTKTMSLINEIDTIDFVTTNNELEAILLENNLIKTHQPRFSRGASIGRKATSITVRSSPARRGESSSWSAISSNFEAAISTSPRGRTRCRGRVSITTCTNVSGRASSVSPSAPCIARWSMTSCCFSAANQKSCTSGCVRGCIAPRKKRTMKSRRTTAI
jgi:hypothetical protein